MGSFWRIVLFSTLSQAIIAAIGILLGVPKGLDIYELKEANIIRNRVTGSIVIPLGAILFGGVISVLISQVFINFHDYAPLFALIISAAILLFFAMLLAMNITRSKMNEKILDKNSVGGGSLDSIKNSIQSEEIRNIAAYVWMWTCLMTIQWITAINIIEEWSSDSQQRISFFATIEQIVSPLTLLIQLFLTNIIIRKVGIKNIMILYGFLFLIAYLLYGFFPSIVAVAIVTVFLRVFEYGFNKPTREIISVIKSTDSLGVVFIFQFPAISCFLLFFI